jgi:hypothetical protein
MGSEKVDFSTIGFDDFRRFAEDPTMSTYEKIGFPDSYRQGNERQIFEDILAKLPPLSQHQQRVLDIGPGCSDLPRLLIDKCAEQGHQLFLVDSAEMLLLLPERPFIHKVAAQFPFCAREIANWQGSLDVVLCYSVLHYLVAEVPALKWFDATLSLLAPGGHLLLGDIPNISKRKRFFSSESGVRFHQEFMRTAERPAVEFNRIDPEQIDDTFLISLLLRARNAGFDAYLIPQNPNLPMANRREDLLIVRP